MQDARGGYRYGQRYTCTYIIYSYMEIYRCVGDLTHFITGQKKEVKRKACTSLADTCSGDTDTEHLLIDNHLMPVLVTEKLSNTVERPDVSSTCRNCIVAVLEARAASCSKRNFSQPNGESTVADVSERLADHASGGLRQSVSGEPPPVPAMT